MTTPTRPRHTFGRRGTGTPQKIRIVAAVPVARPRPPVVSPTVVPDGRVIRTSKTSVWDTTLTSCRAAISDGFGKIKVAAAAASERKSAASAERREKRILAAEARAALADEARAAKELKAQAAKAAKTLAAKPAAVDPTPSPATQPPSCPNKPSEPVPSDAPHWTEAARTAIYASFPFANPQRASAEPQLAVADIQLDRRAVEELISYDAPAKSAGAISRLFALAKPAAASFIEPTRITELSQAPRLVMAETPADDAAGGHRINIASSPASDVPQRTSAAREPDTVAASPEQKLDTIEATTGAADRTDEDLQGNSNFTGAPETANTSLDSYTDDAVGEYDAEFADVGFDAEPEPGDALEEDDSTQAGGAPSAPTNDWIWGRAYFLASAIAFPAGVALAKMAGAADNGIAQLGAAALIAVMAFSPLLGFVAFLPAAGLMWLATRLRLPLVLRALITGSTLGSSWALLSLWDGKTPPTGAYGFIAAGLLGGIIFWRAYTPPTPSADASEPSVAASD